MGDTLESLRAERDRLLAEVRVWFCESCRTVYPGPPQKGAACVMCPKCEGATGPLSYMEKRELRARIRRLEEALREAPYREGYCEKFTDGRLCPPHHLTPDEGWVRSAWELLPEAPASTSGEAEPNPPKAVGVPSARKPEPEKEEG